MRIDVENPHGPTSREEIASFEARRKVSLPEEYKAFLLKSNGGSPVPNVFQVPGFHYKDAVLDFFYGIHNREEIFQLDKACDVYAGRIPADLIPIADDPFGNVICLGWKGKRRGKIYFWDHENEGDEQDYGNVHLVASSLAEFLDTLQEGGPR